MHLQIYRTRSLGGEAMKRVKSARFTSWFVHREDTERSCTVYGERDPLDDSLTNLSRAVLDPSDSRVLKDTVR